MAVMKATKVVDAVQAAGEAVQRGDFEFHYKAVSEALNALNWLMIDGNPRDVIDAQLEASDYNANKIRIKFKRNTDKFDQNQHDFCDSLKQLLKDLSPYTKAHHMAGVSWNFKGGAPRPSRAPPPPPPPPPPLRRPAAAAAAAGAATAAAAATKAALAGMSTSTLKTVTKDQQTWRRFAGGAAPAPRPPAGRAAPW